MIGNFINDTRGLSPVGIVLGVLALLIGVVAGSLFAVVTAHFILVVLLDISIGIWGYVGIFIVFLLAGLFLAVRLVRRAVGHLYEVLDVQTDEDESVQIVED